jgi:hypothetical protein
MHVTLNSESNSLKFSKTFFDIIGNAEPSVNMTPCRITRGHFILLAIVLFVLLQPDNIISYTECRMPLVYLASYPVYRPGTFTFSLARHFKKTDIVARARMCVCVCVCDKCAEGVHVTVSCRTESYQCPVKMEGITRSLRTVIRRLSQQTWSSITHQKNNVVIIYCCYLSHFS